MDDIKVVEDQELEKYTQDFQGIKNGLVRVGPKGYLYPKGYMKFADKIYQFKVIIL